jgi:hypothetical protein
MAQILLQNIFFILKNWVLKISIVKFFTFLSKLRQPSFTGNIKSICLIQINCPLFRFLVYRVVIKTNQLNQTLQNIKKCKYDQYTTARG